MGPTSASESFAAWSRSWWLAPIGLSSASLELQLVHVPALRLVGEVESHWSGIREDPAQRSGRAPHSGVTTGHVSSAFLVTSTALTREGLRELGGFGESFEPFVEADFDAPWEAGHASQRMAVRWGHEEMLLAHRAVIAEAEGLKGADSSGKVLSCTPEHVLVPVYIGTFDLRGTSWRLLVNGVTGHVVGRKPTSQLKSALLISVVSLFLGGPCVGIVLLALTGILWSLGRLTD